MAPARTPGTQCNDRNPANIQDGTLCRAESAKPGIVGFFQHAESKVESSARSVADSASRVFNSGYKTVKLKIGSGVAVIEKDADDIIPKILGAKNWTELKVIAEFALGDTSFELGVCFGMVEHLGSDVVGILSLLKTIVLAGFYEQAQGPWYRSNPVAKLAVVFYGAEMKKADDQCKAMLNEIWEIIKHPIDFVEKMGGKIKAETVAKWKEAMLLGQKAGLANRFQEGRIVGGVLYEVIMAILLVMSVAGAAVKLAARVPALVDAVRGLGLAKDVDEAATLGQISKAGDAERLLEKPKVVEKVPEETSPVNPEGLSADAKARAHILDGDATGGGHRAGTGIPGKSEFPTNWSDDKIIQEVTDVANDPASKITQQGKTTIIDGTRDGVDIRVVERDGRIVTGYPTNLPKNP